MDPSMQPTWCRLPPLPVLLMALRPHVISKPLKKWLWQATVLEAVIHQPSHKHGD